MRNLDLTGSTYGRLTVIKAVGKTPREGTIWLCRCSCGNLRETFTHRLRHHITMSCGCWWRTKKASTHGYAKRSEYVAWRNARARCHYPSSESYKTHGERGIRMCDEWRKSFSAFIAHIGPKPSPDLTLDRINNDGNYEPGNVRWATSKEQAANRRPPRKRVKSQEPSGT